MNENKTIWIALPVYNEWPAIKNLIENLQDVLQSEFDDYMIVICDDGSTDGSKDFINQIGKDENIHVIQHLFNRGLADAIRDIFEYVAENGNTSDVLVRMDGDATHNPIYLKELINEISENCDVAVASRIKTNDRQLSIVRRVYSLLARYFVRLFFPVPKISEYTGGFRAYSLEIIQKAFKVYGGSFIQLGSFGFVCTFEKLIKLSLINAKFSEVPFELEYENKTAESKMVPWITILGYILLIPVIYWPKTGWKKRISKL